MSATSHPTSRHTSGTMPPTQTSTPTSVSTPKESSPLPTTAAGTSTTTAPGTSPGTSTIPDTTATTVATSATTSSRPDNRQTHSMGFKMTSETWSPGLMDTSSEAYQTYRAKTKPLVCSTVNQLSSNRWWMIEQSKTYCLCLKRFAFVLGYRKYKIYWHLRPKSWMVQSMSNSYN